MVGRGGMCERGEGQGGVEGGMCEWGKVRRCKVCERVGKVEGIGCGWRCV